MSANLWDASTANRRPDAGGVWLSGKSAGSLYNIVNGSSKLAEDQTVHMGASLRGAGKGSLEPYVEYRDAAGNFNWVGYPHWTPTGQWQRFEGTCVVPSGMTVTKVGFVTKDATGDIEVSGPVFSYGSPVTLASSAHTPYATQDHIAVTYATQASLKVTDNAIKAEVSARTQTDHMVSDLSSRLTQTADGFSATISRLSDTDKKVNSWFDFGSDSSGDPQLTMGSSTSPVVGTYTNSGLAYKTRAGATLLELDATRSATTADHMEAQDVAIGKWRWVQTQGGTHLTLVWAG